MVKICLNMIVKNESKIIERLLDSVKPIIDMYCICDTGSTDNTVELIENYGKNNNLEGIIVHKPFENFCVNRNFALEEAKKMDCDFILLLDADMKLVITPEFSKDKLELGKSYSIKQKNSSIEYSNVRIISKHSDSKYFGVTHEYIGVNNPIHTDMLYINDIGDGGAKGNKAIRDKLLLEQGIKDEPNNVRYYFYLANTYSDMGDYHNAIKTYLKRIEMGGWNEEVFYSYYRLGICYKIIKDYDKMVSTFLKGFQYRPERIETIYELVKHYTETKEFKLADLFYQYVKDAKVPNDVLFVHHEIYNYSLHYEFGVYAYYNKNKDVYLAYDKLFNYKHTNLHCHFNNYKFYCPVPKPTHKIEYNYPVQLKKNGEHFTFYHSTPSIIRVDDRYIMNCRLVNYVIENDGSYKIFNQSVCTINKKVVFDLDLNELSTQYIHDSIVKYPCDGHCVDYSGIEDIRLYYYNDEIYYSGTSVNRNIMVGYGKYGDDNIIRLKTKYNNFCEKNWLFIPNSMKMVYNWYPLLLGEIKGDELVMYRETEMPMLFKMARGSTNGIEYDGHYWFIVHFVHKNEGEKRFYYHSIVCFDKDMNLIKYTYPFKFSEISIEYCLGLIIRENDYIMTHSKNDQCSILSIFPKSEFKWIQHS